MDIKLKHLVFIPVLIFVFSLLVLLNNYKTTGDFITKDVDLKGGTLITIESSEPINTKLLEERLSEKHGSIMISSSRTLTGYGVNIETFADANTTQIIDDVEESDVTITSFSVESIGPVLGELFWRQVVYVLIVAFVLMSLIIFVVYRVPLVSFSIIFAILANIIATLAITSILGIKISFASFAGLLMLIAYSVDTNIVLTSKVLKGMEGFNSAYKKALRTGLTLTGTITVTMVVVLLLSTSKLMTNIAGVLVVGFLMDIPNTWILNSFLIEWYVAKYMVRK